MATSRPGETEVNEITSTLSGIGQWVGLIDTTMALRERYRGELESRSDGFVDVMEMQLERYEWFVDQIDTLRPVDECCAALDDSRDEPAAWERALVELSLWTTTSAEIALETWEPPAGDLELELFHKICLSGCRRAHDPSAET